jgi:hypothetical protein
MSALEESVAGKPSKEALPRRFFQIWIFQEESEANSLICYKSCRNEIQDLV